MTPPSTSASNATEPDSSSGLWSTISDRLEPPRLLSLTRAGKFFVLMTLGVGFGAINTGNNLLFLLLGMMLSLIIASGILSEAVLRNLIPRRKLPRRLHANRPAPGTLRLVNDGWWPALSVEASEQNPVGLEGPASGRRIGPESIPWWKFWRRQTHEDRRPIAATYCMRIAPDTEQAASTHYQLPVRGRYRLPGLQLKTRFPFGLFEKTRRFDMPSTLTVYPDGVEAEQWLGTLDSRWGDTAHNRRGRGEEFYGLREYRPGEDQRLIHWKSTARRGEPVVRENEARQRRALLIVCDNRSPSDDPTPAQRRQFETGIRHLTGLLNALRRRGYRTQLLSLDGLVRPETEGDIEPLLRHLATIELVSPDHPSPISSAQTDELPKTRLHVGFERLLPPDSASSTSLIVDQLETFASPVS